MTVFVANDKIQAVKQKSVLFIYHCDLDNFLITGDLSDK